MPVSTKSSRRRSTKRPDPAPRRSRLVALHLWCETADCDNGQESDERLSAQRVWALRTDAQWFAALQCPTCGCLRGITAEIALPSLR